MKFCNNKEFLKTLSNANRIVYLCGAGLSISLGQHNSTWSNWIKKGIDFLDQNDRTEIEQQLINSTTENLINAAGKLLKKLKQNNNYDKFMSYTIETIEPKQQEIIEFIKLVNRRGDIFATTNYDLSIEKVGHTDPITYNNPGEILNILKRESDNKVIHLHGAYSSEYKLDDIVADEEQYKSIVDNQGAQFIQNLISTYPIIVIGCGGTVEDPNLKSFLQFSKKYLNKDVPYYYLYCEKESINSVPKGMIPICYGKDYSDLPLFLNSISMYRIRNHSIISEISRINPYEKLDCMSSAYARMHYSNKYIDFIGRKKELAELKTFIEQENTYSWWMITGEGGIGKSRLVLEWLYNLPSNWFGFFLDINKIDNLKVFEPFANTVIAIDYICGKEEKCAQVISLLQHIFDNSIYKLRIVLLERHFEPDKKDWFTLIKNYLNPAEKMIFEKNAFQTEESNPIPLNLKKLIPNEEKEYINKYVNRYVKELNSPELERKYLNNINITVHKIHKKYKSALDKKLQRPLFLSIFIEVWIYKSGIISIKDTKDLLECYMEKEEKRYLDRFNSDNDLLYSYMKLIALSSAVEFICVNDNCLNYQEHADKFFKFLLSENQPGKKKTSWTDLFVYTEPNKDKPSELFYILEPFYPDIIREFIVSYYIDENEITNFAKSARYISTMEFGIFLMRALDDFPKSKMFRQLLITPPNEAREYFEYYVALIHSVERINDYDFIIEQILNAPEFVTENFGGYELMLWDRIATIQAYKLDEGENVEIYYKRAEKFVEYLNKKFHLPTITENFIEVIEKWFIALHNNLKIELADKYLKSIRNLINKTKNQENLYAIGATFGAECHQHMLVLHAKNKDFDSCKQDLKIIENYLNEFPNDEDIMDSCEFALSDYITAICGENNIKLMNDIIPKIENIYNLTNKGRFEVLLCRLYANLFVEKLREYSNNENFVEFIKDYKDKIVYLYKKYQNNEVAVSSYLHTETAILMEYSLQELDYNISDELYDTCVKNHKIWKESIEIAESLGRVLYLKGLKIKSDPQKRKELEKIIKDLSDLNEEVEHLNKIYANKSQEVETYLRILLLSIMSNI